MTWVGKTVADKAVYVREQVVKLQQHEPSLGFEPHLFEMALGRIDELAQGKTKSAGERLDRAIKAIKSAESSLPTVREELSRSYCLNLRPCSETGCMLFPDRVVKRLCRDHDAEQCRAHRFGVEVGDVHDLLARQGWRCASCRVPLHTRLTCDSESGTEPCIIDHDHESTAADGLPETKCRKEHVRAALCSTCNRIEGHLRVDGVWERMWNAESLVGILRFHHEVERGKRFVGFPPTVMDAEKLIAAAKKTKSKRLKEKYKEALQRLRSWANEVLLDGAGEESEESGIGEEEEEENALQEATVYMERVMRAVERAREAKKKRERVRDRVVASNILSLHSPPLEDLNLGGTGGKGVAEEGKCPPKTPMRAKSSLSSHDALRGFAVDMKASLPVLPPATPLRG